MVILNFDDYIKESYDHLISKVPGNNQRYYEPVNEFALEEVKNKIQLKAKKLHPSFPLQAIR